VGLLLEPNEDGEPDVPALKYETIDAAMCKLLVEFREWIVKKFGRTSQNSSAPSRMFDAFDAYLQQDGQISREEFEAACKHYGFQCSTPDGPSIGDLFIGLDLDGEGSISKEEMAIVELDDNERHVWFQESVRAEVV